jgi:plasmid stabilization system protein ParE
MAHEVHFSDPYLSSLEAAIDNLWLASPATAARFAEQHDRRIAALAEFPRRGQPHGRDKFSLPVGKSGYRLVYEMQGETVALLQLVNVRRARR